MHLRSEVLHLTSFTYIKLTDFIAILTFTSKFYTSLEFFKVYKRKGKGFGRSKIREEVQVKRSFRKLKSI